MHNFQSNAPSMGFSRKTGARKILRFFKLYGLMRTVFKVVARSSRVPLVWRSRSDADIAMVGCGQYAFATIGYFITQKFGARFRWCYDPDSRAADGFARGLRVSHKAVKIGEWLEDPRTRYVYIASNHASHSEYACEALAAGRSVYLEKPVSVTFALLARLEAARQVAEADGRPRLFAGYNRPFSGAISQLCALSNPRPDQALSLSCFVSGHLIDADHWYRNPNEGTRICGNAGHWIDLFVHLSARRGSERDAGAGMDDKYRLSLLSADTANADDDFALSIASDRGDIFSLMLTARSEPFEGINETINFQQGPVIAKIDDFRRMTIWEGANRRHFRFWPKDVGHSKAILQPFGVAHRQWSEVLDSSILMLAIAEMARNGQSTRTISLVAERARLASAGKFEE
jgi:predicted dehydrogenase